MNTGQLGTNPVPRNTPEMAQEMQISLPICGCTWLGSESSLISGSPSSRGGLGLFIQQLFPEAQQGSVESQNRFFPGTLGLEEIISRSENSQVTPQPWLLCVQTPCQPANSELAEFMKLKMPFAHLLLSHHIYTGISGAF